VLEPDRTTLTANGVDVALVTVKVVDDRGRTVPAASNEIIFTVTGAGKLLGVGNGDSSSHESGKGTRRTAFHGLCLAIVQASHTRGAITMTADSGGLRPATVSIDAQRQRVLFWQLRGPTQAVQRATAAPRADSFCLLCGFGSASARITSPVMTIVNHSVTDTYKPG
jgi:hypothetical protein